MQTDDLQSFQNITGYGAGLADALDRFHIANSEQRTSQLHQFEEWLLNSPYADSICFLDITSHRHASHIDTATTLIWIPRSCDSDTSDACCLRYQDIVEKHFIKGMIQQNGGHTLAAHTLFTSGLVHSVKRLSDRVTAPLLSLGSLTVTDPHTLDDGYFCAYLGPGTAPSAACRDNPKLIPPFYGFRCMPWNTFSTVSDPSLASELSKLPISDQWNAWVDLWRKYRTEFPSGREKQLGWVAALPVLDRSQITSVNRSCMASVFIGLDESASTSDLHQIIRYLLLFLYESNLMFLVQRRAVDEGERRTKSVSTHEVKHVALAINEWVRAGTSLFEVQTVPRDKLCIGAAKLGVVQVAADAALGQDDLAVVLMPCLFDQGVDYLVSWLMGESVEDLRVLSKTKSSEALLPHNHADLVSRCWTAAFDSLVFAKAMSWPWTATTARAIKEGRTQLRSIFPETPCSVSGDPVIPLMWRSEHSQSEERPREQSICRFNIWFARILMQLARESVQHGCWGEQPHIAFEEPHDGRWRLIWSNKMFIDNVQSVEDRKRRVSSVLDSLKHLDAKIDELAEALICENGRSAVSSSNTVSGTEVLEQLVKQIGGEVVLTEQCVVDSEIAVFARVFSFPEEPS